MSELKRYKEKKKLELDLFGTLLIIILISGSLIFFMYLFTTAFHNIDLAYNFGNDSTQLLNHYNLFTNESQTPNELYSSGWSIIFSMLLVYNVFSICVIAFYSVNLAEKYHEYRKKGFK